MTVARLWLRTNRRIVAFVGLVTIVAAVGGLLYASTVTCDPNLSQAACERFLNANPPSTAFTGVLALLPILFGIVLGVGAVGRELDDGTATFAWSIAVNRRSWLTERTVQDAIATALLGLACGAVNAVIVAKLNPGHDIAASFVGYGLWGPILIARGLCGYAIGLVLGALIGRVVAAVTLGLIVVAIVTPIALIVGRAFEPATIVPGHDRSLSDAMVVEVGALAPNGTFIAEIDCINYAPPDLTSDERDAWISDACPAIASYLLGSQMPAVEVREAAALGIVVLLCSGAAFAVVANRRP